MAAKIQISIDDATFLTPFIKHGVDKYLDGRTISSENYQHFKNLTQHDDFKRYHFEFDSSTYPYRYDVGYNTIPDVVDNDVLETAVAYCAESDDNCLFGTYEDLEKFNLDEKHCNGNFYVVSSDRPVHGMYEYRVYDYNKMLTILEKAKESGEVVMMTWQKLIAYQFEMDSNGFTYSIYFPNFEISYRSDAKYNHAYVKIT